MSWAEPYIEEACRQTERWLAGLPEWPAHVLHENVSSHFGPTILSEADCVLQFARHLNDAGMAWEDMHFELSKSKWLFAAPHPGAVDLTRWRADLAIVRRTDLSGAQLPALSDGFRFEAFLEFKLASNHWQFGPSYGDPAKTRASVVEDAAKVRRYVENNLCRVAYVIVFEECDHSFPAGFERELEGTHPGCRVRILRRWRESEPPQAGLARRITSVFVAGELDLSARPEAPAPGWGGVPEVAVVSRLRTAGVDDVGIRLFLTLTTAMDRARDADALWHASEQLFLEQRWVFDPREVRSRPFTELGEALRSYRVSQRHSADGNAWRVISRSLAEKAAPPVNDVIETGRGDAEELLAALTRRDRDGLPLFPLLQGPKIGTVWVRMLAYPGGGEITSLEVLPVAVDVQVRKVTEYLGVSDTSGMPLAAARRIIQRAWFDDVRRDGATGPEHLTDTASALDPALWFVGKWGCTRCERAGHRLPIADFCGACRFDEVRAASRKLEPKGVR